MKRIIEILKAFSKNCEIVSLNYLVNKFGLSERTILKDITVINKLFAHESNCYIQKWKNNLLLLGSDKSVFITKLIKKLDSKLSFTELSDFHSLIIYLAFGKNYLTSERISELIATNLYSLKRKIKEINYKIKYFSYQVAIKYQNKKGWYLEGKEKDLRFLSTNILECQQKVTLYDEIKINLASISIKIIQMIKTKDFSEHYYHSQLVYFLIVQIKRIKNQKFVYDFHLPEMLLKLSKKVENEAKILISLFAEKFAIKLTEAELNYLKLGLLLTRIDLNLEQDCELYTALKQEIIELILNKFCYPVVYDQFIIVLAEFLQLTFLKLIVGYFSFFKSELVPKDLFNHYMHGFELLKIIGLVFKKFNINGFDYVLSNDCYLILFESTYLQNYDHKIPMTIFIDENEVKSIEVRKLIKILNLKYPNLTIKFQNINVNNINSINFNDSKKLNIIVINNETTSAVKNQKSYLLNLATNDTIAVIENVKHIINQFLFAKIKASVVIFNCFWQNYQLQFFKDTLFHLEKMLSKKYRFENLFLANEENLIDNTYIKKNILVVKKVITASSPKIPIILIYFKHSLIYKKRHSINFLFYIIKTNYSSSEYELFSLFLNSLSRNKIEINDIKNLHTLLDTLSF